MLVEERGKKQQNDRGVRSAEAKAEALTFEGRTSLPQQRRP